MDWLIFADDWAAHPSTTQHLVKHFPSEDQIVWVNSIGMRSPRLSAKDLTRMIHKAGSLFRSRNITAAVHNRAIPANMQVIDLPLLPWHANPLIRRLNQPVVEWVLGKALSKNQARKNTLGILAANPVAVLYLGSYQQSKLAYLRLDDYGRLPGVDPNLAAQTEDLMYRRADVFFATARSLLPKDRGSHSHYLPQGVDWTHFAQVPSRVPRRKIVGFHGLLAEWIDYELIRAVALALPDWTFEFIGPIRSLPDWMKSMQNITLLPAVAYSKLPSELERWDAAWIPFCVNELTQSVNPLKLREYLAAGLPTLCTPLPEAISLDADIHIVSNTGQAVDSLLEVCSHDDSRRREARKKSVFSHDWSHRSSQLRKTMQDL